MVDSLRQTPISSARDTPQAKRSRQDKLWFFDVLPRHPPPYPGECLSGYLLRLAEVNGCASLWGLVRDLFPLFGVPRQVKLLYWEYAVDDWGRIPLRTQLPHSILRRLTVEPLVEKFRPLPPMTRPSPLSPGNYLRGVVHPHLQVCPLCVQEQPYVRLIWRLAPVQVCLHHRCLLQSQCHQCGSPLTALGPTHRHLRCAVCDADLRTLPVVSAPTEVLGAQWRWHVELQYLLDPDVTLVKEPPADRPKAIGLKFRYLREQAGLSMNGAAHRLGVTNRVILGLESAERVSLAFCLKYLEALSWSWPDFAALEVPHEFIRKCEEPPFLALRLCPNPECPNHQPPPGLGVLLVGDLPDCQRAYFQCKACGRRFARTYEGELSSRPHRPPLRPGDPHRMNKSPEEIARFVELGLQGLDNRQIARQMGWGPKTVQIYWICLDLEEQVHQAQAKRRVRERQERCAALWNEVEPILESMLSQQDEEITLVRVSQALGHTPSYLRSYPDILERVQAVAASHNAQVKQRQYEALSARVAQAIEEAKRDGNLSAHEINRRLRLSHERLRRWYPELYTIVQQAVREYREQMRAARVETRCQQINEAAARLIAKGASLTHSTILQEAGFHRTGIRNDPEVEGVLRQWVRRYASGEW